MSAAATRGMAVVGYGKMGQLIEQLAPQHGFEVRLRLDIDNNAGGAGITAEIFAEWMWRSNSRRRQRRP